MKKKLAIFAEGGTEQYFIKRLLLSLMNERRLQIELKKFKGGSAFCRTSNRIEIDAESPTHEYFVVIHDCGGDGSVQSDVQDNYDKLVRSNFDAIIGIRDVYPKIAPNEVQEIRNYLYFKIPTKPIKPTMVLVITEIEAWFLAEHTHFLRINEALTLDVVKTSLGFDPSTQDVETRDHPTADLNAVYQAAGEEYKKTPQIINRTIEALDCGYIYLELPARVPALSVFVQAINEFFG